MGLVLFALKYRVTFYVLAVFILLAGGGSAVVMRKDVLPEVNIPVVNVLWTYTGLDSPDMQNYVTSYEELAISNNVVGVRSPREHHAAGHHPHQGVFLPGRRHQPGADPGDRRHQRHPGPAARRHPAAGGAALLRVLGAGDPARGHLRQGERRRRSTTTPDSASARCCRRCTARPSRRPMAACPSRRWSTSTSTSSTRSASRRRTC